MTDRLPRTATADMTGLNSRKQRSACIKAKAAELGFHACAIARADTAIDPEDRLGHWLEQGYHADMDWMVRQKAVRQDPARKLPGVRSVVVLARNYLGPEVPAPPGTGTVARYARGRDYHRVLRKPLRALAAYVDAMEPGAQSYASADSGPVQERAWAARAGLGWIGRNSLVLRRDMGSYFFLATVLSTVELAPDSPMTDHCGACRACIDACPTDAIADGRMVDSNRCISYQTIENRGNIPEPLQPHFEGWVFGCDICQEVCPWNKFAQPATDADLLPRPGLAHPGLEELATMDEDTFRARFAGTPLMRAKHTGMRRNARVLLRHATNDHPPKRGRK